MWESWTARDRIASKLRGQSGLNANRKLLRLGRETFLERGGPSCLPPYGTQCTVFQDNTVLWFSPQLPLKISHRFLPPAIRENMTLKVRWREYWINGALKTSDTKTTKNYKFLTSSVVNRYFIFSSRTALSSKSKVRSSAFTPFFDTRSWVHERKQKSSFEAKFFSHWTSQSITQLLESSNTHLARLRKWHDLFHILFELTVFAHFSRYDFVVRKFVSVLEIAKST